MKTKLPERIASLSSSATFEMARKCGEMVASGVDVVNMSVGEPDFPTPAHIKKAAFDAIENNYSKYSPVPGFTSLKEAVSRKLQRENGLSYSPAEILVSNGAKQCICNAVLALVEAGDEVIIPAPDWVS